MKKVIKIPLDEVWDNEEIISNIRIKYLKTKEIKDLIKNPVKFYLANIGDNLVLINETDNFKIWKKELINNICENEPCYKEDFPGEYFYFASLWKNNKTNENIILFEKYH